MITGTLIRRLLGIGLCVIFALLAVSTAGQVSAQGSNRTPTKYPTYTPYPTYTSYPTVAPSIYENITQSFAEDGTPILGSLNARVTLVIFVDFTCPHCLEYLPTIHQIVTDMVQPATVRLEYRLQTFVNPSLSTPAARAALCAGEQNHFWEMQAALFDIAQRQRPQDFTKDNINKAVAALKLDSKVFAKCLAGHNIDATLQASSDLVKQYDVVGVPSVMISVDGGKTLQWIKDADGNDTKVGGVSIEVIRKAVEGLSALPVASTQPSAGSAPGSQAQPLLNPCTDQPFVTVMTGTGLKSAQAQIGGFNNDQYVVGFTLANNAEAKRFSEFTATHIGQPMAIVLDGQILTAPTIQAELKGGGVITGNFTQDSAKTLAAQLQYGALPIPIVLASTQTTKDGLQFIFALKEGYKASAAVMKEIQHILQQRATKLKATKVSVQVLSDNQISVTLVGLTGNQEDVVNLLQPAALIEFVDFSKPEACKAEMPTIGQYVLTDEQVKRQQNGTASTSPTLTPTAKPAR